MLALFRSLRSRRLRPEIMDQPDLDPELHRQALRALGRLNLVTRTASALWPRVRRLAREKPIRVRDLGCGGGGVAIALRRRAVEAGLEVEVEGCDISPVALEHARRQAARHGAEVRFFELDVLGGERLPEADVMVSSLFFHHFREDQVIGLLRRMAQAVRSHLLVDDLIRSPLGYLYAYTGCHLMSRSPVVHNDGPISVAGAFTPDELLSLAREAGLDRARVERRWPERLLLSWRRS